MADYRLTAQLQHAIMYPQAQLDRWASFGQPFEMDGQASASTAAHASTHVEEASVELAPRVPADAPAGELSATETPLADAKTFILGGKAIFTLQGKVARYTYRVTRVEPQAGGRYSVPAWFVSYLTGPDNLNDYTYVGMLDTASGAVRLTRKSQLNDQSTPVVALRWALRWLWAGKALPAPAAIYHVGRCGRCGRALTVPSSVENGFGPECLGKL